MAHLPPEDPSNVESQLADAPLLDESSNSGDSSNSTHDASRKVVKTRVVKFPRWKWKTNKKEKKKQSETKSPSPKSPLSPSSPDKRGLRGITQEHKGGIKSFGKSLETSAAIIAGVLGKGAESAERTANKAIAAAEKLTNKAISVCAVLAGLLVMFYVHPGISGDVSLLGLVAFVIHYMLLLFLVGLLILVGGIDLDDIRRQVLPKRQTDKRTEAGTEVQAGTSVPANPAGTIPASE